MLSPGLLAEVSNCPNKGFGHHVLGCDGVGFGREENFLSAHCGLDWSMGCLAWSMIMSSGSYQWLDEALVHIR